LIQFAKEKSKFPQFRCERENKGIYNFILRRSALYIYSLLCGKTGKDERTLLSFTGMSFQFLISFKKRSWNHFFLKLGSE